MKINCGRLLPTSVELVVVGKRGECRSKREDEALRPRFALLFSGMTREIPTLTVAEGAPD